MAAGARRAGGVEGRNYFLRIPDRTAAMAAAVELAQPGDIVIACGKGHEQSMCFGEIEHPWRDQIALAWALTGGWARPTRLRPSPAPLVCIDHATLALISRASRPCLSWPSLRQQEWAAAARVLDRSARWPWNRPYDSDFRDRISVAVWGVIHHPGCQRADQPAWPRGQPGPGRAHMTLPIAAGSLLPALLALLAGSGAQAVVQAHPLARHGRLRLPVRFWALPIAVTMIATMVLPRAPSLLYWGALLLAVGVLLSTVLVALYFSLDPTATGYRRARAVLTWSAIPWRWCRSC
jgi:hypothetical protein